MATESRVVSDTGPLISLEKLSDNYAFIRRLYDRILVPPAVLEEVAQGQFENSESYLAHYGIADLIEVRQVSQTQAFPEAERLHEGEVQAIQLAKELGLPLLIEETAGRRVALDLGIHISGVAGQVLRAFRENILPEPEAQRLLDELLQAGRINRKIYEALVTTFIEL